MAPPADIERLITLGLNRYGAGDLDGALLMWEEALAIDPDNEQAASYVDYVRLNYELLSSEPRVEPREAAPFAIEEEPEYQIEIIEGELVQRDSQEMKADERVDAGWFDDSEPPPPPPPPELSFDDATREYHGKPTTTAPAPTPPAADSSETDFSELGTTEFQSDQYTAGFPPEATPVGFRDRDQETEIRKRDFGFVQPTAQPPSDKPAPSLGSAPTMDSISIGEATQDRSAASVAVTHEEPDDERDLLEGLPMPNRAPDPLQVETQDIPLVDPKAVTKELPGTTRPPKPKSTKDLPEPHRPPARRESAELSQAEVMLNHSPTQDFQPKIDIGAPTRELGIRPAKKRPGTLPNPVDEDAPTKQSDVRAIRDTAREQGRAKARPIGDVTNNDIVLPFDPIEARAAQILDEVDAEAPAGEVHDDQTRRRINALLEKALAWLQAGDSERAVCAVDLAIAEDPNSALGQKLITRNRDTIMQVFQGYLGDLDRQPQLAKPLHELQNAPISPRAAFLLSRIDGTLTIDELLDVSGMPRLEAYRHLCQLYLRGILR